MSVFVLTVMGPAKIGILYGHRLCFNQNRVLTQPSLFVLFHRFKRIADFRSYFGDSTVCEHRLPIFSCAAFFVCRIVL